MTSFERYVQRFCNGRRGFDGVKPEITYSGYYGSGMKATSEDDLVDASRYLSRRPITPEERRRVLVGGRQQGKTQYLIGVTMSVFEHENREVIFCVQNRHMARNVFDIIMDHPYARHCRTSRVTTSLESPRGYTFRVMALVQYERDYRGCYDRSPYKVLDDLEVGDWDLVSITGMKV